MIKRTVIERIKKSIMLKPITLITGARQVGKSTICRMLRDEKDFGYVSLDNSRELMSAKSDPANFLKIHKPPVMIDEIQYCPELFMEIESLVNEKKFKDEDNSGMFVLTGSQVFGMMANVSQSMAGRVSVINVLPLSRREVLGIEEQPFAFNPERRTKSARLSGLDLFKVITRGFYPEIHDKGIEDVGQFYSDYVMTYIERDVSQIISIKDKLKYQRFMELIASLVCEEVVYDVISANVSISLKTAQEWMSALVSSGIVTLLEPYFENSVTKRVVKRPKLLFNDTGLAAYLAGLDNPNVLMRSRFSGRFVENYIINEIIKSFANTSHSCRFYYYRDSGQNEIDLIALFNSGLMMVECKSGVQYSLSDTKAFDKLKGTSYEPLSSGIVCAADSAYAIGKGRWVVSLSDI